MKLNLQHYLMIFVALLTGATAYLAYELIQEKTARSALEASQKILEADFAAQQEHLQIKFDSIKELVHYQDEHIADLSFDLSRLDDFLTPNKSKKNEEDTRVHRTDNADSLRSLVTRRFER